MIQKRKEQLRIIYGTWVKSARERQKCSGFPVIQKEQCWAKGWAPFSSAKVLRLCKSRGKSCLEISSAKRATCLSSNQTLNEKCEFYVNHLESMYVKSKHRKWGI